MVGGVIANEEQMHSILGGVRLFFCLMTNIYECLWIYRQKYGIINKNILIENGVKVGSALSR